MSHEDAPPKFITDNETIFFQFLEEVESFENLDKETLGKLCLRYVELVEADPDKLAQLKQNTHYRLDGYFEWLKLERVINVLNRKKAELRKGIKNLPRPYEYAEHMQLFRNYVADNINDKTRYLKKNCTF